MRSGAAAPAAADCRGGATAADALLRSLAPAPLPSWSS
jgi:hypothetical protein